MSQRNNTMPIVILVLGILSLMGFGFLTGAAAWFLGNKELSEWPQSSSEYTMIQIGRIIGAVITIISLLGLCFFLVFILGIGGLVITGGR